MNTNQFENNIKSIMDEIEGLDFFQDKVSTLHVGPYIQYKFDTTVDQDPTYLVSIVFACFDSQEKRSKDNKDAADKIENKFNKKIFNFEGMSIHSLMTLRQNIPNEMLTEKQAIELQFDLIVYQNKEVEHDSNKG